MLSEIFGESPLKINTGAPAQRTISLINNDFPFPGSPKRITPFGIETPFDFKNSEFLNHLRTDNNSCFWLMCPMTLDRGSSSSLMLDSKKS